MPERPLSVGELAVHFGLEPIEVEWLLENYETGTDKALMNEIECLDCTPDEARRLLTHIREAVEARRRSPPSHSSAR
jgi:hypothetical protein